MRPHLQRLRASLEPLGIAPAEALALLVLLLGAAALTGVVWWTAQPPPVAGVPTAGAAPVLDLSSDDATGAAGGQAPPPSTTTVATESGPLVVHVTGQVTRPGVVTLAAGARVAEAIEAAGGATDIAVLDALNLARMLVDGEQVRVPGPGEEPLPASSGPVPPAGLPAFEAGPLDLNTATVAQLDELPGVGPVTAERIVAHRDAIGGFAAVTQLLEVAGIGPARFADLEPRVRVGP